LQLLKVFYQKQISLPKGKAMKKGSALLVILLLGISAGCGKQRKKQELPVDQKPETAQKVVENDAAIPLAQDQVRSFFDDDLGEFELVDNSVDENPEAVIPVKPIEELTQQAELADEFAWTEEEKQAENNLQTVYFDFNRYVVKTNENEKVAQNAETLKKLVEQQEKNGSKATVVVEGHACHAAGSAIYNMALSEKRAKDIADRLVAQGVSRDQIKIVGRGKEFPAIVNGKPVTGSIEEQWPNRRGEISVINA
jgi:outer membrane protein OmpA-like peptidoglycan-associated protein